MTSARRVGGGEEGANAAYLRVGTGSGSVGETGDAFYGSKHVFESGVGVEAVHDNNVAAASEFLRREVVEDSALRPEAVEHEVKTLVEFVGVAAERSAGVVMTGPARCGAGVGGAGMVGGDGVVVLVLGEGEDACGEDIGGGAGARSGVDKVSVEGGRDALCIGVGVVEDVEEKGLVVV